MNHCNIVLTSHIVTSKAERSAKKPIQTFYVYTTSRNSSHYSASCHAPFLPWTAFIIAQKIIARLNQAIAKPSELTSFQTLWCLIKGATVNRCGSLLLRTGIDSRMLAGVKLSGTSPFAFPITRETPISREPPQLTRVSSCVQN